MTTQMTAVAAAKPRPMKKPCWNQRMPGPGSTVTHRTPSSSTRSLTFVRSVIFKANLLGGVAQMITQIEDWTWPEPPN